MKNLYVEVTHETYECGDPGCCFDAWDSYAFKVEGQCHTFDDRCGSSMLESFLAALGFDNAATAITGTRFDTDPCAADADGSLQVRIDDYYDALNEDVVSCEIEVRFGGVSLLKKTFMAAERYLHDDRWLAQEVLGALGWSLQWR
jgi:hypothetical protein